MAVEILPFDIADELLDDEALAIYLDEALVTGDPAYFAYALGKVAKARGMSRIAREAGLSRALFYAHSAKKVTWRVMKRLAPVERGAGEAIRVVATVTPIRTPRPYSL